MYATVWPLRHRNTDPRMYTVFISITWVTGFVFALLAYLDYPLSIQIVMPLGVVSFLILVASYAIIFIKVKRQHQLHNQSDLQRTIQKERELAKTLLLVTVTSMATWLPLIAAGFVIVASGSLGYIEQGLAFSFCGLNSLCNPVIYFFRMREYRKAVKQLVCKCSRDTRVRPAMGNMAVNVRD
ncbi:predicted protein [Nematostella vectensis]|uniref:G-protein coupled receptors family 1 profile domain-containing protein n=2 Tax=Nematostella vectensis TaxID=45351 RepID=A7RM75_NEMVE|nr:predicted protein [Nematostella vectensis]|eukprot:XP_001639519.1 predicted protein [Nematostella vectensis]